MAETEIKRVIRIESKGGERTVKGLRQEIKSLQDALLNIDSSTEEYTKTVEQLIKDQTELASVLKAGTADANALEGLYNALQAEMAALRKTWKATNDESQRSQIGKRISEINTQLKELDKSIGNSQRNVGNYQEAIEDAFGASPRELIRKYTMQMSMMDDTSKEYAETAVKLAEAQKKVKDAQEMAKFSSQDYGDRLDTIAATGANLASIFGSVQGAMALFGNESENLTKAMYKLQGVMAIVQGLQGLDGIGKNIKGLQTSFGSLVRTIGVFVRSLGAVKTALAATGLGAVLVGLGAVAANWDKIGKFINGGDSEATKASTDKALSKGAAQADVINSELQRMLNSSRGTEYESSRKRLAFIAGLNEKDINSKSLADTVEILTGKVYRQGYIEGLQEEKERVQKELDNLMEERSVLARNINNDQWVASRYKDLDKNLDKINETKEALSALDEKIAKAPKSGLGMTLSELQDKINLYEEYTDELEKIEAEHQRRMEALRHGPQEAIDKENERYQKALEEYNDKLAAEEKKRTEELKKQKEEKLKVWKDYVEKMKDEAEKAAGYGEEIAAADLAAMSDYTGNVRTPGDRDIINTKDFDPKTMSLEGWKKALRYNQYQYEEGVADDNKRRKEAIQQLYIKYDILSGSGDRTGAQAVMDEINDLNKQIIDADNSVTQLRIDNMDRIRNAGEELRAFEKLTAQERINAAVQATQSVGSIIGSIGNMMNQESEDGFEAYKSLMMAQNAINTVASATAAYYSQASIPVVGPALGALAAAAAVASGVANQVQISRQQFGQVSGIYDAYSSARATAVNAPEIPAWNPQYQRNVLTDTETDALYNRELWVSVRDINAAQNSVKATDRNSKF